MPLQLLIDQKEVIFFFMKKAFSDFMFFDDLVGNYVKDLIEKSTKQDFDAEFMNTILDDYPDTIFEDRYKTKEQKTIMLTIKYVLYATTLFLFAMNPIAQNLFLNNSDELLARYPEFREELASLPNTERVKELQYLRSFRNYLVVAKSSLLPPKQNKILLFRIIERLEGSNEQYITGSKQKASTTRRCKIYERETGIVAEKRPRKRSEASDADPAVDSTDDEMQKKRRKVKENFISRQPSTYVTERSCAIGPSIALETLGTKNNSSQELEIDFDRLQAEEWGSSMNIFPQSSSYVQTPSPNQSFETLSPSQSSSNDSNEQTSTYEFNFGEYDDDFYSSVVSLLD